MQELHLTDVADPERVRCCLSHTDAADPERAPCCLTLPQQVLSKEPDVRTVLQRRFDMCTWFKRNGFPVDTILENAVEAARQERIRGGAPAAAPGSVAGSPPGSRSSVVAVAKPATSPLQKRAAGSLVRPFLILTDFDKTLTDYDAGAGLC